MGGLWSKKEAKDEGGERGGNVVVRPPFKCNPYVLRRVRYSIPVLLLMMTHTCQYSSQFFDEDGDLAHEFYEECRIQSNNGPVRWTMRLLKHKGIRPQVPVFTYTTIQPLPC